MSVLDKLPEGHKATLDLRQEGAVVVGRISCSCGEGVDVDSRKERKIVSEARLVTLHRLATDRKIRRRKPVVPTNDTEEVCTDPEDTEQE